MARRGSYELGFVKYVVKTPLTVVGFVSMYLFGGGILSVFSGISHLITSRNLFEAILVYFLTEYLPTTSIGDVIVQVVVGSLVAGAVWYWNTAV